MSDPSPYEELRSRYRPDPLEVLLIGESPPAPRGDAVPFFYADHLGADNSRVAPSLARSR